MEDGQPDIGKLIGRMDVCLVGPTARLATTPAPLSPRSNHSPLEDGPQDHELSHAGAIDRPSVKRRPDGHVSSCWDPNPARVDDLVAPGAPARDRIVLRTRLNQSCTTRAVPKPSPQHTSCFGGTTRVFRDGVPTAGRVTFSQRGLSSAHLGDVWSDARTHGTRAFLSSSPEEDVTDDRIFPGRRRADGVKTRRDLHVAALDAKPGPAWHGSGAPGGLDHGAEVHALRPRMTARIWGMCPARETITARINTNPRWRSPPWIISLRVFER